MKSPLKITLLFLAVLLLAGCDTPATVAPTEVIPTQPEPTLTEEVVLPTEPELPMALKVNGEGILLTEYEAELVRLQSALVEVGEEMTPEEQKQRVLDNLVDGLLLSQAAAESGFTVTEAEVQSRIDRMVADLGGMEKLVEWKTLYGYTDETFRASLTRSIAVAWQRDEIINAVPQTAEQIHARQLIYQTEGNANEALIELNNGVDFTQLAEAQDPILKGDLGWFPRGFLTQPVVEEAVFALQPGQTTGVIKSDIGYHIVNVLERETEHPLSIEARLMLQEKALTEWLDQARESSNIEVLVP